MRIGINQLLQTATLALLVTCSASATPVFNIGSGTLTVSRLFNTATLVEFPLRDVRGLVSLDVFDPGGLGTILVADNSGGTDPNFVTLTFGVTALNGANGSLTELAVLTFDLAGAVITPNTFMANAIGTPNGPVSDPALMRLLGTTTWSFNLSNLAPIDTETTIAQYTLASVTSAVPEPGSASLVLLGAGLAVVLRRVRRR